MRNSIVAGSLLSASLLVAACSGGSATTAPTVAPASQAPASEAPASEAPSASAAAESPAAESPAAGGAAAVNVGETSLGSILVDGAGRTLYIFTADSGGQSACYDDCAKAWPILASDGNPPALGAGLDAADFATIERTDGTTQVTFKSMPLYYFQGDQAAGDVNGQGLNEKWYVVTADGTVVQ
jgi:predicted lipoprotein with Yx(FWY)xxD motif